MLMWGDYLMNFKGADSLGGADAPEQKLWDQLHKTATASLERWLADVSALLDSKHIPHLLWKLQGLGVMWGRGRHNMKLQF